jgi:poly(ADP-ribose) glycohydrolase
LSLKETTI